MAHQFHPTVLREYDIRGIIGETLGPDDARAIGRGFATLLRRAGGELEVTAELAGGRVHVFRGEATEALAAADRLERDLAEALAGVFARFAADGPCPDGCRREMATR